MRIRLASLLSLGLLILSGCATGGDGAGVDSGQSPPLAFAQVKAAPESFVGQTATFGGAILSAKRLKDGTRLEILQLPLNASFQPTTDLTTSQGRFVALRRDFLDPATLPPGTFVTVTGAMTGSMVLPLDETTYTYPTMEITHLQVWKKGDEVQPRIIRPYIGPGPTWGPYWSPYWRPWPYW